MNKNAYITVSDILYIIMNNYNKYNIEVLYYTFLIKTLKTYNIMNTYANTE